jgi:hypothetical protein
MPSWDTLVVWEAPGRVRRSVSWSAAKRHARSLFMVRYRTAFVVVPLVAGLVFVASGQAPAKTRGVLAQLSPEMPVSLTDSPAGYEIGTFVGVPDMTLGYTVLEVGPDHVVLEDIAGIRQHRIPIYAIKGVVTTTLKPKQ